MITKQRFVYLSPSIKILYHISINYYSRHSPIRVIRVKKSPSGAAYLSKQSVFRLAPKAGIELPADLSAARKLKYVQERLESGHPGAKQIWQNKGLCLGFAIAHYAEFYDLEYVLLLGRITSGSGGYIIMDEANLVLREEFPELTARIKLQLPDETSRRYVSHSDRFTY